MSPGRYTNGRKKRDGGNEVVGVGIIIAAAFVLLCIIVPPVIGLVSRAVNGIVTGIFGFTAYPVFICLLIYGISLAKNIEPALPGKYIAAISVAAVCLVLVLQLAITNSALNMDFAEYVSYVYDRKNATAGVLAGIISYGLQAGISLIFTYILLSVIIICCVLALFGVFGKIGVRRRTTYKKAETPSKPNFQKSGAAAAPVKSVMDNSLFVGTIEPPASTSYVTESGSYSELPDQKPASNTLSGYYSENAYTPESEQKSAGDRDANDRHSEALRILYGDKSPSFSSYGQSDSSSDNSSRTTLNSYGLGGYAGIGSYGGTTSYGTPVLQSEPAVKYESAKPPKIVHRDLPEIVYPAEKDFSGQMIDGEIINGDALSARLGRDMKESADITENIAPPASSFNTKKLETEDLQPKQAPIMNGDYFGTDKFHVPAAAGLERDGQISQTKKPEAPVKETPARSSVFSDALFAPNKNVAAEHGLPPIYTPETSYDLPPKEIELEPAPERKPVTGYTSPDTKSSATAEVESEKSVNKISSDNFSQSPSQPRGENSFESLLKDEPAMRGRVEAEKFSDDEAKTELPESGTSEQAEQHDAQTDSGSSYGTVTFNMPDEVEDLSEKRTDSGKDYTGYYTKEKSDFETRVNEIDSGLRTKKSKVIPNQINLEDYNRNAIDGEELSKPKRRPHRKYNAPPTDLLQDNSTKPEEYGGDCQEKARILEETLENLKLPAKVSAITKGPAVTRYELEMPPGQSIKKIESFQQDIAYNLASNGKIRIETPIPGKRAVGIEVPNEQIAVVALRDIIISKEFQKATSPLTLALGKDIAGQNIVCALEKMPHLLIAGATNSGKSACLNAIIMSILYKSSPEDVRLILVDPKEVEFRIYRGMPHLLIPEILTDTDQASNAFKWAKTEMDRRYKLLSKYCARNVTEFNNSQAVKDGLEDKMYSIVIIVDELAELMLSNNHKEFEDRMTSVAQKARAAGIHLILATQRPSVNIITGTIKANLPSRIAFAVTSFVDSKTILDEAGAEALLGRGDMLYAPLDKPEPTRVQGAYVTTEEVASIVSYVRDNNEAYFDEDITTEIMSKKDPVVESAAGDDDDEGYDVLMKSVLKRVIESGQASTSMIQRRFSVGYARASRIIDQMESNKFIGPLDGSKPREVYITREQFKEIFGEDIDEVS